jgi:hypothetical protein
MLQHPAARLVQQTMSKSIWIVQWGKKIRKVGVNIYLETAGSPLN